MMTSCNNISHDKLILNKLSGLNTKGSDILTFIHTSRLSQTLNSRVKLFFTLYVYCI